MEFKNLEDMNNCHMYAHNLLAPYPILHERDGTIVAQFKFTVLVLPNGIQKLGGYEQLPYVRSDYTIEDQEINEILALPLGRKKNKKKRKKKKNNNQEPAAMEDE
eukprot:TRINITY_DN125646_c0_g1_i2.p1 TRINITY_DN125646_c0_g1~~TRINITY_DN125646_c0_g1_i2.p1  ORF type:complete len:105 (-),score=24.72 TRINITY_DN125646_c0_g1_i2:57-371(-)